MRITRRSIFRLSSLLTVVIVVSGCAALPPKWAAVLSPPARIGAVESFFRPLDAQEAGVGFERIIFEWRYFQPDGPDDWITDSIPDSWLLAARQSGRSVIGLLKNAPNWATGSKLLGAPAKGLDLPLDDPDNYWAGFVRKVVSYYSSQWGIHHWIIYNEPDIRPQNTINFEFAGTVRDYYNTIKVAYLVAHATDPQAVIHLAGFTYWQDVVYNRTQYLDRFVHMAYDDPQGRTNNLFFDVLSVHVFSGTDWVWYIPRLFEGFLKEVGAKKPLWIDELNARVTDDQGYIVASGDTRVTLDQQASFIIQGVALGFAAGAERVEIYKLYDNDMHDGAEAWGLIRNDGTRRPGYYALKMAIWYFTPTITATRLRDQDATMVTLEQPGRTVYVIWNRTPDPIFARIKSVNGEADATLVSTTGSERPMTANNMVEGAYELYLPGCSAPCFIQGEPQILIQPGPPQEGWTIKNDVTSFLQP